MKVQASAPCRADLAGGTLDIWPLGLLHHGAVTVNAAIPVRIRLEVEPGAPAGEVWHAVGDSSWRRLGPADATSDLTAACCFALRPEGGLAVRVLEQAPLGSGLGGSSAYGVALGRALVLLEDVELSDRDLVALVRDFEACLLGVPTGTQDHWAAVRGGALALHLEPGGERVEPLAVDPGFMTERLSVFFTGITHHSGMVNWQVIRRRLEGDPVTTTALEAVATAARFCRSALLDQDEAAVAAAVGEEWRARKRLAPEVCPPELEHLEAVAVAAGALAVKACGAGGGGSLLLWHQAGAGGAVARALAAAAPAGRLLCSGLATAGCAALPVAKGAAPPLPDPVRP